MLTVFHFNVIIEDLTNFTYDESILEILWPRKRVTIVFYYKAEMLLILNFILWFLVWSLAYS